MLQQISFDILKLFSFLLILSANLHSLNAVISTKKPVIATIKPPTPKAKSSNKLERKNILPQAITRAAKSKKISADVAQELFAMQQQLNVMAK